MLSLCFLKRCVYTGTTEVAQICKSFSVIFILILRFFNVVYLNNNSDPYWNPTPNNFCIPQERGYELKTNSVLTKFWPTNVLDNFVSLKLLRVHSYWCKGEESLRKLGYIFPIV